MRWNGSVCGRKPNTKWKTLGTRLKRWNLGANLGWAIWRAAGVRLHGLQGRGVSRSQPPLPAGIGARFDRGRDRAGWMEGRGAEPRRGRPRDRAGLARHVPPAPRLSLPHRAHGDPARHRLGRADGAVLRARLAPDPEP